MRRLLFVVATLAGFGCAPARAPTGNSADLVLALDDLERATQLGDVPRTVAHFTRDARVVDGLNGEPIRPAEMAALGASGGFARASYRPDRRPATSVKHVTLAPSGRLGWFEAEPSEAEGATCAGGLAVLDPAAGWLVAHCEVATVHASPPTVNAESEPDEAQKQPDVGNIVSSPAPDPR